MISAWKVIMSASVMGVLILPKKMFKMGYSDFGTDLA